MPLFSFQRIPAYAFSFYKTVGRGLAPAEYGRKTYKNGGRFVHRPLQNFSLYTAIKIEIPP